MKRHLILALCVATMITCQAQTPQSVLEVAQRVNNYFVRIWPDPTLPTFVKRERPSSLWTRGVYYEGLMALYDIDPQQQYLDYTDKWADFHHWTPRNGTKTVHADDQCCEQTYLDRYMQMTSTKMDTRHMTDSVRMNLEKQMKTAPTHWTWIDAIQMAMPVYSKMYLITKDKRYILYARDCYEWSRNTCGGGLWNKREGLWWRDADFVPPYKEKDGKNCYWSRGNGWVVAAYVKVISDIEATLGVAPDAKKCSNAADDDVMAFLQELKADYTAMMKALVKCQRKDGFWNVSLVSPVTYGGKETSGTALFTMGLAWGLRTSHLKGSNYRTAADRAWNAMQTEAIHPDGFIGYLQGTGKEPKDGQPVTYNSIPDFEDYGTGCFLLCAAEYYKLIK